MSDATDALIVALVSILGSLLTFNVGIRQVRRSVTLLRLRVERRMTLLDLALAGEAA